MALIFFDILHNENSFALFMGILYIASLMQKLYAVKNKCKFTSNLAAAGLPLVLP